MVIFTCSTAGFIQCFFDNVCGYLVFFRFRDQMTQR
ncbi:Uncharacterised protein [Vibrio cholerae]|nr:Uncharacterised protein [Vibrio cholerae]